MLVLGWLTVQVLDQVWDVSDSEFVFVTFINSSALVDFAASTCRPRHFLTIFLPDTYLFAGLL